MPPPSSLRKEMYGLFGDISAVPSQHLSSGFEFMGAAAAPQELPTTWWTRIKTCAKTIHICMQISLPLKNKSSHRPFLFHICMHCMAKILSYWCYYNSLLFLLRWFSTSSTVGFSTIRTSVTWPEIRSPVVCHVIQASENLYPRVDFNQVMHIFL